MFIKNQWYVFCSLQELSARQPLGKTVCGLPMVAFRGEDGKAGIMLDLCPHRRAPLSMGKVEGNTLRCIYHGMQFNAQGQCLHIPSQSMIPNKAHVRSFPVLERYGFLWVWPGEGAGDASLMPSLPWRESPDWNSGLIQYFHVKASYLYMNDNLLDLSHVAFLHESSIGFDPDLLTEDPLTINITPDQVVSTRRFENVEQAPAHREWFAFPGRVTRLQEAAWSLPARIAVLVRNAADGKEVDLRADHLLTPETETSHHYYIALSRNFRIDDDALSQRLNEGALRVHQEDVDIAEAQQRMALAVPEARDLPLMADRGMQAAHRIMKAQLEKERETVAAN